MATLTVQTIDRIPGLGPTYSAAAGGGDSFIPSRDSFFHVKNGGGSSITVTVVTPSLVYGDLTIDDLSVSVPAGGERMIGPFPKEWFEDVTDGLVDVTYSGVTTVTVAAFKLVLVQ